MLPQGWAKLVALLDGQPDADSMSRLERLCALCAQVTGAAGASVSLTSHEARSTVCATDDIADLLEELQDAIGEGPRHDALDESRPVLVSDLDEFDRQWPAFVPAARTAGARAVFVLPIRIGALRLGLLTMYRTVPGPLSEGELKDALMLTEAASVLLVLESGGEGTSDASAWVLGDRSRFRPQVHQAVGMTMVHLAVGPREAFARLCAHAYATDTPLAAVASQILTKRLRLEQA